VKLITFIILTLFSISEWNVHAENCNRNATLNRYKQVTNNLQTQISTIDKVLTGEKIEGYNLQNIFGYDFDIKKTDDQILELKKIIEEKQGVLVENNSLSACLTQLGLKNLQIQLSEKTTNLIKKKIELLEKNKLFDDSIRESGITESVLPEIKNKIDKDSSEALKAKSNLEDRLIKNQTDSLTEKSSKKREILEYENNLTKIKIELLNKKIETNNNLEEKIKLFEKLTSELKTISSKEEISKKETLLKNFQTVEKLWLSLSSENYFDLFRHNGALDLPSLPPPLNQSNYDYDISNTVKLRTELIELRKDIVKNYTEKKNQELKLLNHLVANSSAIRENYYNSLGSSFFFKSLFQLNFIKMIKNEIISAPYRAVSYFYSKYLFIQEQLSLGREGYINLLGKLLFIFFIIGVFFGLKYLFTKTNSWIDHLFEYFFRSKRRPYLLRKLFSLWSKLKDSSVSFFWLITLYFLQKYRVLNDVSLLVKIAEVYLASKIIKSFVTIFLGSISRLDSVNFIEFKKKASETSDKFKNIFIFYFFTMIFIEATVGKVYLYTILNYFVIIYSLYHFFNESSRWEVEFRRYSERMFAGVIVEKFFRFLEICPSRIRATFLLFFIILFITFDTFTRFTENFEISKKISANLFKKQIEKVEAEEGADDKIPHSYKEHFSLKSISTDEEYVPNGQGLEDKITQEVLEWAKDTSDEHSLVVYGDKGVGKTTLLKKVSSLLSNDHELEVKYAKMPSKTITKNEIDLFIRSIFNEQENKNFDFYDLDQKLNKKIVVVIDECQNIFLSQTGGFDAYYELINLINLNTENIFWIMSFNKYSWLYLDRAFGRTQFFRNVFELSGWSDSKIKELIMRRHKKSDFRLSYDLLISATRSQDEIDKYASIESKFFKLLWELSRGNPRAALFLWITALSKKSRNVFNVNIPKNIELDGIDKIPDELLFVIAQVLKHENLSSSEIESTTNLQKGLVRNAIKLALEKNFFFKDNRNRYMVDITTQYGLIRYLRVKNFIYGN
tara:strand:- start:3201 stop:6242 length:3042 start_codon:yes stop_codon:yes gene_type:complete